MPTRHYDDLISLRDIDSISDLLSPIVYRPSRYTRDDRYYPYDSRSRRRKNDDGSTSIRKTLEELTEPSLDRKGDLGWTLEYATAFCYRHLNVNRPCIVDTIDTARQAPLNKKAPFLVFDSLDRNLFQGKLKGMVYLKWRSMSDNSPGVTSAPGIRDRRICIELNTRPFEERDADLEDLLDALIHQMIHAYFLVCCGAPDKEKEGDGRLLDGLHFGVLLSTIKDISEECEDGSLRMVFYAHRRAVRLRESNTSRHRAAILDLGGSQSGRRPYIAIDPHGDTMGPPPTDGQSHCMHDNRRFRGADIRNWQVSNYACAIELDMEKRGNTVYDLDVRNELVPVERLRGPPSSTYVELKWDDKRIMVPSEKVMGFDSIKKPSQKEGKHELNMPKCDFHTLKCFWDFVQHRKYAPQHTYLDPTSSHYHKELQGPPIIVPGSTVDTTDGILVHIRVFKVAESMKFTELQKYAMERLYELPTTSDDPITALKEIYNENDKTKPIHSELHKWARKFLARTDEPRRSRHRHHDPAWDYYYYSNTPHRGVSNYEKLISIHGGRFQELYHLNPALKDDSKLVVAQLSYPGHLTDEPAHSVPTPLDIDQQPASTLPLSPYTRSPAPLARRRSFSDFYDPVDWRFDRPRTSASYLPVEPAYVVEERLRSRTATPIGLRALPSPLLEEVRAPYYDYFSRSSGRRRRVNPLTGERYTLSRERWRDLRDLI
ncbi:hypothetical protein Q7P37_002169 [Cladosporium fusiforme]